MSKNTPDGDGPNEWDDRGDLVWNEFDWEEYLRQQDEVVGRYIAFYEQLIDHPQRLDETAHFMGWDKQEWSIESEEFDDEDDDEDDDDDSPSTPNRSADPYTLLKNHIYIATKALYSSLRARWEAIASDSAKVPQALAIKVCVALQRGEEQAIVAIQALDFGDYAMAVSQFKRALRELNQTFSHFGEQPNDSAALKHFREEAMIRLFDLREMWLRVMHECREEIDRPSEGEDWDE